MTFRSQPYEHILLVKSVEDGWWIQGPVPTLKLIVPHSFELTFHKRRTVSFLLFISCAWAVLILLVFPCNYICTFLIIWKSYQLYSGNLRAKRNGNSNISMLQHDLYSGDRVAKNRNRDIYCFPNILVRSTTIWD